MQTIVLLKTAVIASVLYSSLSASPAVLNVSDSITQEPVKSLIYPVNQTTYQFAVTTKDTEKKAAKDKDLTKAKECLKRLNSFAAYEKNWNGNEADPFTLSLIERCKTLVNRLSAVPLVFPAADDSIEFEFSRFDGAKLIFFIYDDRIDGLSVKTDKSKSVIENVTDDVLIKEVDGFYV